MSKGFIRLDNDAFRRTFWHWPLTLTALKVLCWIVGDTVGWNRIWTFRPLKPSRIAEKLTGIGGAPLRREAVSRALTLLRKNRYIELRDDGHAKLGPAWTSCQGLPRPEPSGHLHATKSVPVTKSSRDRAQSKTPTVTESSRSVAGSLFDPARYMPRKTVTKTEEKDKTSLEHIDDKPKTCQSLTRQHEDELRNTVRDAWVAARLPSPKLRNGDTPDFIANWLIARCIDKVDPVGVIALMVSDGVTNVRGWVGKMTVEPVVYELRDRGVRSWDLFDREVYERVVARHGA